MGKKIVRILVGSLIFLSEAQAVDSAEKARNRIEELFKWKVSDSLHLDVEEEAKFSDLMKDLGEKRKNLSQKMTAAASAVTQAKKDEDRKKLFEDYKSALKNYADLQVQEVEGVEKLLGPHKAAQYVVLKSDLNTKFKDFLSGKSPKDKKTRPELAEPKVIEGN